MTGGGGALAGALAWFLGPASLVDDPSVPVPVDSMQSFAASEAAMDALLASRFPEGSDPARLRRALLADGFVVVGTGATLVEDEWMCRLEWAVAWSEEGGRLGAAEAALGGACL